MAEKREKDPCKVMLKDVRLGHPALFRPKAYGKKGDGDPAYQSVFYLDKDNKAHRRLIEQCEDAIAAAKSARWGDKPPKLKSDKIALKDGDKMEDPAPEQEGHMVLSTRSYKKPRVLDRDKTELDESDGKPYGGCYVDSAVRFWAQDNDYGQRINCEIQGVRFRRDGEPFGAAPFDDDEFDDLDDEDEDDAPRRNRGRSRDDDDEDERPKKRRSRDDDDEEDERPKKRRSRDDDDEDDDDEEDERPKKRRSRDDDDDEDDEEDRPSRNSRNSRSRKRRDDDI